MRRRKRCVRIASAAEESASVEGEEGEERVERTHVKSKRAGLGEVFVSGNKTFSSGSSLHPLPSLRQQ